MAIILTEITERSIYSICKSYFDNFSFKGATEIIADSPDNAPVVFLEKQTNDVKHSFLMTDTIFSLLLLAFNSWCLFSPTSWFLKTLAIAGILTDGATFVLLRLFSATQLIWFNTRTILIFITTAFFSLLPACLTLFCFGNIEVVDNYNLIQIARNNYYENIILPVLFIGLWGAWYWHEIMEITRVKRNSIMTTLKVKQ